MAVQDVKEKIYYKVIPAESYVRDGKVHAAFLGYLDKANRDKEKAREERFQSFLAALEAFADKRAAEFDAWFAKSGLSVEEVFDTERGVPKQNLYPEAFRLWTESDYAYQDFAAIKHGASVCGAAPREMIPLKSGAETLKNLGYDPAWLSDPVVYSMSGAVCCGDYLGEPLTAEFYYNKFKENYVGETADC